MAKISPASRQPFDYNRLREIPQDFFLIIDTREQEPFFMTEHRKIWTAKYKELFGRVVIKGLPVGDYSLQGFEDKGIVVERKTLSDLLGSLGQHRKRFEAELEEMSEYEWKALVIEADEEQVLGEHRYGPTPNSIRQSLASFEIKYDLHVYYNKWITSCERWVLDRLCKYLLFKQKVIC